MAELIVAKHRNGPLGTIPLVFMERFTKFVDLTHKAVGRAAAGSRRARRRSATLWRPNVAVRPRLATFRSQHA